MYLQEMLENKSFALVELQTRMFQENTLVNIDLFENPIFKTRKISFIIKPELNEVEINDKNLKDKQLIICLRGGARLKLTDNTHTENFWIDNPTQGVFARERVRLEMHDFMENTLLAVLSSD